MKASSSCGNNNANNASNSLASVCEENSSDESIDVNRDPFATKKINFNQMSEADDAPGVASENNVTDLQCSTTDLVAWDSAENMIKCATQSLGISNNESVMGATRRKMSLKVITQKELHDVDELKRAKRRQSNRESARRSRMRKQAELQKLREALEVLKAESASLKDELLSRSSEYLKLKDENESIMEELKLRYREDEIPYLEAFMPRYLMNSESYRREENSVLSQSRTSSPSSLNVGASSINSFREQ